MKNNILKIKTYFSFLISHLSSPKGFTLIELLVAISIVGVLSAVTIVTINPFRQFNKAKDTQRQHTLSQLRTALADYYLDNDYYPESLEKLAEGNKPYINSLPNDPDGFSYEYLKPNVTNPQWAAVFSQLEPETTADATKSFCPLTTLDSGSNPCVPRNYYYEQTKTIWACATVGKVVCNEIAALELPAGRIIRPTATTAPPTLAPTDAPTPTITLIPTATPISLPAPVAYWNMDEPLGTTTVANSPSGTGLDGTSNTSTNVSAGKFGNARTFDGTSNYIYIPDIDSLRFTNALTFAAWLNTSLTANGGLFSRGGGWSGFGWDIIINPGSMDFRSSCLTSGTDNYTSTGLTSGSGWHHFVVTFDSVAHSIKTYRDGNLISSSVTGGDGTPKTPTGVLCGSSGQNYIGMGQESDFKYKGLMDEVRIYNRAFSPNEVQALYSITPTPTPILAHCADGSDDAIYSGGSMVSCSGVSTHAQALSVCASGSHVCTIDEYLTNGGRTTYFGTNSYWLATPAMEGSYNPLICSRDMVLRGDGTQGYYFMTNSSLAALDTCTDTGYFYSIRETTNLGGVFCCNGL